MPARAAFGITAKCFPTATFKIFQNSMTKILTPKHLIGPTFENVPRQSKTKIAEKNDAT